jgi:hypothetical protein
MGDQQFDIILLPLDDVLMTKPFILERRFS